jgi:hypothetical protein
MGSSTGTYTIMIVDERKVSQWIKLVYICVLYVTRAKVQVNLFLKQSYSMVYLIKTNHMQSCVLTFRRCDNDVRQQSPTVY